MVCEKDRREELLNLYEQGRITKEELLRHIGKEEEKDTAPQQHMYKKSHGLRDGFLFLGGVAALVGGLLLYTNNQQRSHQPQQTQPYQQSETYNPLQQEQPAQIGNKGNQQELEEMLDTKVEKDLIVKLNDKDTLILEFNNSSNEIDEALKTFIRKAYNGDYKDMSVNNINGSYINFRTPQPSATIIIPKSRKYYYDSGQIIFIPTGESNEVNMDQFCLIYNVGRPWDEYPEIASLRNLKMASIIASANLKKGSKISLSIRKAAPEPVTQEPQIDPKYASDSYGDVRQWVSAGDLEIMVSDYHLGKEKYPDIISNDLGLKLYADVSIRNDADGRFPFGFYKICLECNGSIDEGPNGSIDIPPQATVNKTCSYFVDSYGGKYVRIAMNKMQRTGDDRYQVYDAKAYINLTQIPR